VKIIISLGGSIFAGQEGVEIDFVREFSKAMLEVSKKNEVFIVTGGGKTARKYIEAGRALGAGNEALDKMGIAATRLNAMIISASLGESGLGFVPERIEEVDGLREGIFVMGGTVPGHTTDAVSAMLAAHVGADLLINATNVDGVYEKDPNLDPTARRFNRLTYDELIKIVETNHRAGLSTVFDPKAAQIIRKKGIKTAIIDGRKVENIVEATKGRFKGTLIQR
jgi:uridylate kinase